MSLAPSPTAGRGEVSLQPSYFTSSLFVEPFRKDILSLVSSFKERYDHAQHDSLPIQPFATFKEIWNEQGWPWMHFKVFDPRSRDTFLTVCLRLFLEKTLTSEAPLDQVGALFGLYTFFMTQPSTSTPPTHSVSHVPIPIDWYKSLTALPATLNGEQLLPLRPYVTQVLSSLIKLQVFYILPSSEYFPMNPRQLPREIFIPANSDQENPILGKEPKKKGRPSKRDKTKKAKATLTMLEAWLTGTIDPVAMESSAVLPESRVTLATSRNTYLDLRNHVLDLLVPDTESSSGGVARDEELVERANQAVLSRLRKIDELAAAKGLEVGGEGGDRTGLGRVDNAVAELGVPGATGERGGILRLLEGAGVRGRMDSDIGDGV